MQGQFLSPQNAAVVTNVIGRSGESHTDDTGREKWRDGQHDATVAVTEASDDLTAQGVPHHDRLSATCMAENLLAVASRMEGLQRGVNREKGRRS